MLSAQKHDSLYHLLNFQQDILTNNNTYKEDAKLKQLEDDIRRQEEKHHNMRPQDKQDANIVWASISSIATTCNCAGEGFLKIGFDDLAFPYLDKARRLLDSISRPDLKGRREWKILKVAVTRNLSFYYNNKHYYKKASECLKTVLELQKDFEGKDIISGFEFVYINLAFFSKKLKNWGEAHAYAEQAVNYLENLLEIKKGVPILENRPATKEKHITAVYYKKLITLSYAYHILASSLIRESNNYVDAINYLEKAYSIGREYLGKDDKLTLKFKKKFDLALEQISQPQTQSVSMPRISNNFMRNGSSKMLEVQLRGSSEMLMSEVMTSSPAVRELAGSTSNRATPQGSQFFSSVKHTGHKQARTGSLISQMSAQMPQSTKNVSFTTQQNERDRFAFGSNQPQSQFDTFISSRPSSAMKSPTLKMISPEVSMLKDREVRPKLPRASSRMMSIYGQDSSKPSREPSPGESNKKRVMRIETEFGDSPLERPELTSTKSTRLAMPSSTAGRLALSKMIRRPPSAAIGGRSEVKVSGELGSVMYSSGKKPQEPQGRISHSEVKSVRTSIVNYRPASPAVKPKRSPPKHQYIEYMETLNIPAIAKSKSRSPNSKSPSLTLDDEFGPDRMSVSSDDWSAYDTGRSGVKEERTPREFSSGKKGDKLSQGLMSMLKTDAKKNISKLGSETIFTKVEDKPLHSSEQTKSEERGTGVEHLQIVSDNKVETEDRGSPKMDLQRSMTRVIAKELMKIHSGDVTYFRRLEQESARKIQQFFRGLRRTGKISPLNFNPDEQNNVMSANELNSIHHGRPLESLADVNIDNPSHNNFDTQSSAKHSRIFRRDLLMKFFTENDCDKINFEGLYTSLDDQAYEFLNRYKSKKEDEEEFSINRSFTIENNFMLPKSQHQMTPKIEVIKRNLKSLKAYEISFYGFFFGEAGLWTVRYGGLHEKKGNLFLIFYLCHGTINHPIRVRADLKVTEKAMFYSTIWRVISANMNVFLTKDELIYQLKDRIQSDEERLFLIIKDLKSEERLSPILRITPSELDSLREMLIKLCFIIENKFIIYKKGTGYIYEWSRNVENSQTAFRNKHYLVLSKGKLQKQIRKLASQYNPFYYTTAEKVQYSVKVNTIADGTVIRTFSGGIIRKSMGTLGSDSDGEVNAPVMRSQTSQSRELNNVSQDIMEFRSRRQKPTEMKESGGGLRYVSNKEKEKTLIKMATTNLETQVSNVVLTKLLDHYKNPFVQGQLLFQSVVHHEHHFVLINLRMFFSKFAMDEVSDESQLEFAVEIELFGASRWKDQLKLPYKEFMDKVKTLKNSVKEFMINAGFVAKQRKLLSAFFNENLSITESKLQLGGPKGSPVKGGAIHRVQNTHVQKLKNRSTFLQRLENHHRISDVSSLPKISQKVLKHKAKVKVIGTHEPNFGGSEIINPQFELVEGMNQMRFYNSLKYIQPRKYYEAYDNNQNQLTLRIKYIEKSPYSSMLVTLYHHCKGKVDFMNIRDTKTQERLINIMQMTSPEMKKKSLTEIFEFQKSLIGNKLLLNEKLKLEGYNRKFDISPINISQILMTQGDENLPKYRLDIQKHFTKGVISNLGNCYITITTYFIKNLYKFDNIFCIKFEIMPFTSKTKFYKFLINSKDIKFYINKEYPKENPYENWDTIHFIIQSLVLKRQYVYSTIELPIKDTKFMLMKYHKYNLKNVVSQSIESSSIGAKVIFGNFLQPKIQENQVILQITKRIDKQYVIITIEKHTILDYWSFVLYDPKTCRNDVFLATSELAKFKKKNDSPGKISPLTTSNILEKTPVLPDKLSPVIEAVKSPEKAESKVEKQMDFVRKIRQDRADKLISDIKKKDSKKLRRQVSKSDTSKQEMMKNKINAKIQNMMKEERIEPISERELKDK